jgi:tetratricopeptide (TPR) repeat protein
MTTMFHTIIRLSTSLTLSFMVTSTVDAEEPDRPGYYEAQLLMSYANGSQSHSTVSYRYPSFEEVKCIEDQVEAVFSQANDKLTFDDEASLFEDEQLYWQVQNLVEEAIKGSSTLQSGKASMSFRLFTNNDQAALYQQANTAYQEKLPEQAIELLMSMKAPDRDLVCVKYLLGNAHSDLEEYLQAILYFTQAIERSPENDRLYYSRGWQYKQLDEYQKAQADMLKSLSIVDYHWETYYQLSQLADYQDEHMSAISYATRGIRHGNAEVMIERRGWAYINSDDPAMALYDFNKAIELNAEEVDYYSGKARALYGLERYPEVLPVLEHALALDASDTYSRSLKAYTLDEMQSFAEAEAIFQSLITEAVANRTDYNNYGYSLLKQNRFADAVTLYQQAFSAGYDYHLIRNNLATAYFELESYALAEQHIKASIAFQSADDVAFEQTLLARTYIAMGRFQEAFDLLKRVSLYDTQFKDSYYVYRHGEPGNYFAEALDQLILLSAEQGDDIVHIKAKLLREK